MPEQLPDTLIDSIADNFAENFFEGGSSSKNVITVPDDKEPGGEEEQKHVKLDGFTRQELPTAAELLGERFNPDENTPARKSFEGEPEKKVEPEASTEDYSFLLDKGVLAGFEDDQPVKSKEDLEALIAANKAHWETEAREKAIKDDREDLPEEVRFIVDYAKKGGGDLKSVFKLLGQSQEFRDYDMAVPEDQKAVVRAYYENQGWSENDIEEEVVNLVENKRLEAQSQKLKPKLDKIVEEKVVTKKKEQEYLEQEQQKARKFFEGNVVKTLQEGKIGDLTLTKEEKSELYNALVVEQYKSFSGVTNRLGALLDKIQYIQPDYGHLMEVTMLLSDREGFKKKLRDEINTQVTADQIKKIKTDKQKQSVGSSHNPSEGSKRLPKLGADFINPFK